MKQAALDTTGMEARHTSHHFRKRREESQKQVKTPGKQAKSPFPKLAVLCDCLSHLTLSVMTGKGPAADHPCFQPLLDQAAALGAIRQLLGDAGFDAEHHHVYARQQHGTQTIIPAAIGRPTVKPPTGLHRRRMKEQWQTKLRQPYGQRWQVETVNSMLKRLPGSALRALTARSRARERMLRILTLNIMILANAPP